MKYMGSKARIAKHILPIILKGREQNQAYVEPFVGGANMIDKVDGIRIGYDNNSDLINLLNGLKNGWVPRESYTRDDYEAAKGGLNPRPVEAGYIAYNCSFSGKYWGRFAGKSNTKQGVRDYTNEAYKNVCKQTPFLRGIEFECSDYRDICLSSNSIVYCDKPYEDTDTDKEGYGSKFDHDAFWCWAREKVEQGYKVFISEYKAPSDFICVWEQEVKSSLSANGKVGGSKKSVERLFVHKTQMDSSA